MLKTSKIPNFLRIITQNLLKQKKKKNTNIKQRNIREKMGTLKRRIHGHKCWEWRNQSAKHITTKNPTFVNLKKRDGNP